MWDIKGNIDIISIDQINSLTELFLPNSVDFAGKVVDTITVVGDYSGGDVNPISGMPLLENSELKNLYLNLYDVDGQVICQNLSCANLAPYYANTVKIGKEINLKLSSVRYVGNSGGKSVLIYISYKDGKKELPELPVNSIAVAATIPATESVLLSKYIEDFFVESGKPIQAIQTVTTRPYYLDINTTNGKVYRSLSSTLFDFNAGAHAQPFLIDNAQVDFRNTYLVNSSSAPIDLVLTLFY